MSIVRLAVFAFAVISRLFQVTENDTRKQTYEQAIGIISKKQRSNRYLLYMLQKCDGMVNELNQLVEPGYIWNNNILPRLQNDSLLLNDLKTLILQQSVINYQKLSKTTASCVSWSADGKLAATSWNNTIRIWKPTANGYKLITTLADDTTTQSCSWSADGTLAIGSMNNTVRVWKPNGNGDYELITTLTDGISLYTAKGIYAWSVDDILAAGLWDNTLKIWKPNGNGDYELITTLTGHTALIRSVSWSADGTLATGSRDMTAKIWKPNGNGSYELITTLTEHAATITSVSWSADGTLATGSMDMTAKIWKPNSNGGYDLITTLTEHIGYVLSVAWSAYGKYLATGSSDMTVKIWKPNSNGGYDLITTLRGHTSIVTSVAWSANDTLATGSSKLRIWDMRSLKNVDNYLSNQLSLNEIMLLKNIAENKKNNGTYQLNTEEQAVYENLGGKDSVIKNTLHKALDRYVAGKRSKQQ